MNAKKLRVVTWPKK